MLDKIKAHLANNNSPIVISPHGPHFTRDAHATLAILNSGAHTLDEMKVQAIWVEINGEKHPRHGALVWHDAESLQVVNHHPGMISNYTIATLSTNGQFRVAGFEEIEAPSFKAKFRVGARDLTSVACVLEVSKTPEGRVLCSVSMVDGGSHA